ncbi:MAG: glycosyltransferase [Clostridium sp.]|nr:glycosyltransferase [Clostridium sp.]MCM1540481.1 glycosyltransferase [Blautia sp.]
MGKREEAECEKMIEENELISIIIPIYNVEEYLDECVRSVVNQTYRRLEIILVDDGSTDGSAVKCDEWAKCDDRIIVIHKENGGLSDARNMGLSVASGALVGFVDGDDIIEDVMYAKLYCVMKHDQADLVCCNYDRFGDIVQKKVDSKQTIQYSRSEFLCEYMKFPRWFSPSACLKLYRKSIVMDMTFEKGVQYEDIMWTLYCACRCKRIIYLDESLYHYRCRTGSIITTGITQDGKIGEKEITDHIDGFKKLEEFWRAQGNDVYANNAAKEYLEIALHCYYAVKKNHQTELYSYLPYLREIIRGKKDILREWGKDTRKPEKYMAGYMPGAYYAFVRTKEIIWDGYVRFYHIYKKYVKRR